MGKQIEFFMTPVDEAAFFQFAGAPGKLRVLRNSAPDQNGFAVEPIEGGLVDDLYCLTAHEFLIEFDWVSSIGVYVINVSRSEVVQFRRSMFRPSEGYLGHGRLWFDERNETGRKSEAFIRWANSLLGYVRRHGQRQGDGRYAVRHASEQNANGRLQLGRLVKPLTPEEARQKLGLK